MARETFGTLMADIARLAPGAQAHWAQATERECVASITEAADLADLERSRMRTLRGVWRELEQAQREPIITAANFDQLREHVRRNWAIAAQQQSQAPRPSPPPATPDTSHMA